MSAESAAAGSAQASALAPTTVDHRAVPARARELAARLSELFEQAVEIVKRLNDAQRQLTSANQRLWSGLAPDAFGLIYDDAAAAAIGTSPIAALNRDGEPAANSQLLDALQHAHWKIHRAFCAYQHACEQRRQLAIEVGEFAQQLTQALCATGWKRTRGTTRQPPPARQRGVLKRRRSQPVGYGAAGDRGAAHRRRLSARAVRRRLRVPRVRHRP